MQNKTDLGVQAIALEIIRDPIFVTSPLLQTPQMAPVYPQLQAELVRLYQQILKNHPEQDPLSAYLQQCLGGMYWWWGDYPAATTAWQREGATLGEAVLAIANNNPIPTDTPILQAWLAPQQRRQWITKALLQAKQAPPNPEEVQAIQAGMERSASFDQWVKQNAPLRQYFRERAGFGVLSRHIDGPLPHDFLPLVENTAVTQFLAELLPSPEYSPALDIALQPIRESLWQALGDANRSARS
ncbi:MAG: hypothetical protein HC934_04680 [Acaryochloridaceae cyanobacterium SU_2_1]|nr:hypothetical protein [Acaryochloridaceae cyanobacterium SU_2_1]